MLEFNTALNLILSRAEILPPERVDLQKSLFRILATDLFQDIDMPPFNKAAVDGFACRKQDLENELEIAETIYAGKSPEKLIRENQCCKIMTGAVVPDGADFVFKKEDSVLSPQNKVICSNPYEDKNICYRGEDIRAGDKILDRSTLISPGHLPVMAGAGVTQPLVFARPEITIYATGSELVEPGATPSPSQIRNSNSSQLIAQLSAMNIGATYGGIIMDNEAVLSEKISDALSNNDVVILTGGVSVGDYDFIPHILSALDFKIWVTSTAIKPGKPMVFAQKGKKYCFGLSGNPVSSFVQFELFVKPFLYALMGHNYQPAVLKLPLGYDFSRKMADRMALMPVNITPEMEVVPVEFHGSAHINALSFASHLLEVPIGVKSINKGERVNVRSI
jgi:molybdopterin molybdotransferase